MPKTQVPLKEIAERGWEIYLREIRPRVIDEHRGEFLVVDVESGDYEVDKDALEASDRVRARHPDGHRYLIRIGYRAAYGAGAMPKPDIP